MNYLAHAYLSPPDPLVLMGNLWGDLLKPKDYQTLDPSIRHGIERHKRIDAFTDQHVAVDEMMTLIRPFQGKYTPVVVDVLMDFILSKMWESYHAHPIEAYCQLHYKTVNDHIDYLPSRLHPRIGRMLEHQWLESCKNRQRMEQTFLMLSRRASFENTIADAMRAYDAHETRMDELFVAFFEDVRLHVSLQNGG